MCAYNTILALFSNVLINRATTCHGTRLWTPSFARSTVSECSTPVNLQLFEDAGSKAFLARIIANCILCFSSNSAFQGAQIPRKQLKIFRVDSESLSAINSAMAQNHDGDSGRTSFAYDLAEVSRQVREFLVPKSESSGSFQIPHPAELLSRGIGNIPDSRREQRQMGLTIKHDASLWLGASLPVHQALFLDK